MNSTQSTFISNGYALTKQFDEYLNLLESELSHDMLPAPLKSVAVRGLKTITGFDMAGWHRFQQDLVLVLESLSKKWAPRKVKRIVKWQERLGELQKFLQMIPNEASRFYDADIIQEVKPLCERGTTLISEMIEWVQQASVLNGVR